MKRIILCLDGTWNSDSAASILTNVAKLHQAIAKTDDNGVAQVSHYLAGIASIQGETAQFLKGAVGFGVGDRIRHAYELLAKDYAPGDEIYLFGFSRGAFEARSLGGLITLFGLAKSGGAFSFDRAWALYRTRERKRDPASLAELRAAAHYPVRIKCVGVWDTVGNIGNPFSSDGWISRRFKFHDTRLSEAIDVGLHALSVDEVRGPFRPTLWTLPKDRALPAHQLVEQVWFAGTHADVGGGHRATGLSDVALLWMAHRAQATTGLAFDTGKLAQMTRPDSLGPQHCVTTGWIFSWSGLIPFIRLVKQAVGAIPPLRRMLLGTWRSGKLRRGHVAINESIHDSVLERFGQRVIELRSGRSRMMTYRPRALVPVITERAKPAARPDPAKLRRIKVFTVHGTFAHDADWDNWDAKDDNTRKSDERAFINRLSHQLRERGVTLDELDHTQYNWSGGNSHDERRTAAIGLKKLIETELGEKQARHGKDYYDAVYIIGHSHGGTVSRLAMNLWDKGHDYYDPIANAHFDEFKHDDQCATCMRARNGKVGPSTVLRPNGVITFGSPFVSFEKRRAGLLTAQIGAWVFRAMSLIPLAVLYAIYEFDFLPAVVASMLPDWMEVGLKLGLPLGLYWLVASYLPRLILGPMERWLGKDRTLFATAATLRALKLAVIAGLSVYYLAYLIGGWEKAVQWLPFLGNEAILGWLWWSVPFVVFWLLAVTLPGRLLSWMRRRVVELQERLPKKYDPSEDRPVPYLSYLTLGDEAGLHLKAFGFITWLVQTLALSAACVLAFGVILTAVLAIDAAAHFLGDGSILAKFGFSAFGPDRVLQDRFIALMDWLTFFPALVWSKLPGHTWPLSLGALENRYDVAWYMPGALVSAIALIFILLMPLVLVLLAVAYVVSVRLRGSGMVFGSEKFAWTLANHITITPRANHNTSMRRIFLAADAWWRRDYAHCFYYKSDRVIEDVAGYMADWSKHEPTRFWPIGSWSAVAGRWLVVLLFVLSVFPASVPIAYSFAGKPKPTEASASDPKPEPKLIEEELKTCWSEPHTVKLEAADRPGSLMGQARSQWQSEVSQKFGAEFAGWESKGSGSLSCGPTTCEISYQPCKPRPLDCQATPHAVEIGFELPPELDAEIRSSMAASVVSTLKDRWKVEVDTKFGADWGDTWFNFQTLRERHPVEESCKEEDLGAGRMRYHCKVETTACKKPPAPAGR